ALDRVRNCLRAAQRHRGQLGIAELGRRGDHGPLEAEAVRFQQAALQLADSPHLATEAELTDGDQVRPGGPVALVGRDRQRHREVCGGLGQAHAARGVDEDIVAAQVEVRAPFQHGDQHVEPIEVDAVDRAPRCAEPARRGETLQLDEQRPAAFERDVDDVAHLAQGAVLQEGAAGVAHLVHPAVAHLEHTDLVGRAKSVLLAAQNPEAVVALAFQIENGVDNVLEHARTGNGALLVDVTHEEDRDVAAFRQQHQPASALAHLADAAGCRGNVAHEDRLDGVDDGHHRPRLFEVLDDTVEVVLGQHHQSIALDAKALRPGHRLGGGNADPASAAARRRFGSHLLLDVTVPVAAFGTATQPFRGLVAALLASEDRACSRFHARNYRAGLRQLPVRPYAMTYLSTRATTHSAQAAPGLVARVTTPGDYAPGRRRSGPIARPSAESAINVASRFFRVSSRLALITHQVAARR